MNDRALSQPAMLLFLVMGMLGIVFGPLLYLAPARTQEYFAWAITEPLTAVFIGGCYCAFIVCLWVVVANRWSLARLLLPAILLLASTLFISVALHRDRLLASQPLTWFWLLGHGVMLVIAPFLLWANRSDRGAPAVAGPPLPPSFGVVMKSWAAILALIGAVLFFIPQLISSILAWSPSPLDSQALGSWHFAAAALQWSIAQQRTLAIARVGLVMNVIVAGLLLIAAPFYRDAFNGPLLTISIYIAILVGLGAYSAFTVIRAWLNRTPPAPAR